MKIIRIDGSLAVFGLRSNSFLVVERGECCVIDPSFEYAYVEEFLRAEFGRDIAIRSVVLTHCHADHCAGLETFAGGTVFLTPQTAAGLADSSISLSEAILHKLKVDLPKDSRVEYLTEGDFEPLTGVLAKAIFTAGHTSDSISVILGEDVFVGDLAFAGGGIGRVDLATGNARAMRESLDWLCSLPSNMVVHSGHGEDFLLGDFVRDFSK